MQHRLAAAFLGSVLCVVSIDQTVAQNQASARVRLATEDTVVEPDGTWTDTLHEELQVLSAAAANQLSQQRITFDGNLQAVEVVEAYTLKPDGSKAPVDISTIITQQPQAPANALAPIYDNQQQKVIIFPNVAAGDTLVFSYKRQQKQPLISGQYFLPMVYLQTAALAEARFTVSAPNRLALDFDAFGIDVKKTTSGDRTVYSWTYSHPDPETVETLPVDNAAQRPHVFLSSLKTYDDFAHIYAGLVQSKIAVTPKIQAQADQITAGITDKRAQAQAIYEWVAARVRYVAIVFGTGGIVPHDAEWVLNNMFGDCKDHAVLFASLLKAKGIAAELVAINAGNIYALPKAPQVSAFNHMIAWLPQFNLYADTTSATYSFGTLPLAEYGKTVMHAVSAGPATHEMPALPKDTASVTYKTVAVMNDQEQLDVTTTTTATGPLAGSLRRAAVGIQAAGPDKFASTLLQRHGMPRATGSFTLSPMSLGPQYQLTSNFRTVGRPGGTFFRNMLDALRILNEPGDLLMGPLQNTKIKPTDPTPCYSGKQIDDISLQLPPGKDITQMPSDVSVKTANLEYTAHWVRDGQTISVHREFISNLDQTMCTGQLRAETAAALEKIRASYVIPISMKRGPAANQ